MNLHKNLYLELEEKIENFTGYLEAIKIQIEDLESLLCQAHLKDDKKIILENNHFISWNKQDKRIDYDEGENDTKHLVGCNSSIRVYVYSHWEFIMKSFIEKVTS